MYEDLGSLFGKGFDTWKNNLILCSPFILNVFFSILAILFLLMAVLSSIGSIDNLDTFSPEQFLSKVMDLFPRIILALLLAILLVSMISSFFEAGAIGMAKQSLEIGKATIEEMWSSGKKNFVNMFLLSILTGLIYTVGLIFLLPGFALIPWSQLNALGENPQSLGILFTGLILLIIYSMLISIVLAMAPYALVVDIMGPLEAVKASLGFFRYNKSDVFIVWLVVVALSISLQMIGSTLGIASDSMTFQPLSMLTSLVSILVLAPLAAIWWTRLYMTRTNKLQEGEKPW
jgi:hypothetical protein